MNPSNTKILIIGHGQHGKDTAAEILRDRCDLSFLSSSRACLDAFIWSMLRHRYLTKDECFEDRVNHRDWWYRAIYLYNSPDRTNLSRLILDQANCYVGMRSRVEYEASVGMYDFVLWVDASKRKLLEPSSSMNIHYDSSYMIRIDNNGTLEDLTSNLRDFVHANMFS